jgi:hypothetical protein
MFFSEVSIRPANEAEQTVGSRFHWHQRLLLRQNSENCRPGPRLCVSSNSKKLLMTMWETRVLSDE